MAAKAQTKEAVDPDLTMRPPKDLIPYARNANTHPETQINNIVASIRAFGFRAPIIYHEKHGIAAGHGRLEAALKMGLAEVPCVDCSDMTEPQFRAYVIADNRIAQDAVIDEQMLAAEIEALTTLDIDLEATGLSDKEINCLLTDTGEQEGEDETPEIDEENVVSQPGDVWILGKHRIMCGDGTSSDDVAKPLNGVEPHLMVTDPPYGVSYDANWRNEADRANGKPYGASAVGKVENDERADWGEAYALFPGDVAYVWHPPGALQVEFFESLVRSGFEIRMQIVWAKSHFPIGRGHYHVQHEPCWYAVRKGGTGHWAGDRKQSTVWNIDKPMKSETGHSTQKPVECMRRPIVNNSSPGQAVYEPFSGSGTTIIAAQTTGRACYAMEVNPAYVDMAVRRWMNMTMDPATRESDGAPFPHQPNPIEG